MSRIGDHQHPRPARVDDALSSASTSGLATTRVQPGETSLAQVAERLQMLLDLLTRLNPQIANPARLQTGQEVFYQPGAALTPLSGGEPAPSPATVAGRQTDAMFEASQTKQRAGVPIESKGPRTIPPFDPTRGPQITNDMWTEEMLTGELTSDQLRNIVDPAAFLNARLELRQKPTDATWVSTISGARQAVNPSQMSTADDAQSMLARLRALGYSGPGVEEHKPENPFSRIEYGSDPRRHYDIGQFNVGLLLERYAKYPKEQADQMTLAELARAGN